MGCAPLRGLDVAVEAWQRVRRGGLDVELVVVGAERPAPRPGLVYAGSVDDDTWADLLAGAAAFCYPTRYEGFGIPALESIASGTPVVCAPVASLPDVLGGAAEGCAAPTADAIAEGLERVLRDATRANALRATGLARADAQPGWDYTANVLLRAYAETWCDAPPRGTLRRARSRTVPT